MTDARGASAEIVAAATIAAADALWPARVDNPRAVVRHRRRHGANGSGLQWTTIPDIIMGWVLTLPAAIMLSATLYWAFSQVF